MSAIGRLAAAIEELVRAHRAASPPPRGLPYLGLELASGTGFHLLDALAARGIFRKYELVLDLGGGLGGASRWLAARLGCEVVCATGTGAEAEAGRRLTRGAGLSAQVPVVAGDPDVLPFRDARFTHVWILEALPRFADPLAALREAYRALRPGGTLAVQDLIVTGSPLPPIPGWTPARPSERTAMLARAGFVDLELRDRTAEAAERSAQVLAARDQLLRRLRADPALAPFATERDALATALATGALGVIQILARRP
ncbi:MAG TPA: methyltransferase domain-containing protein [Candidatus Binatus sp.]|nr:methyltransferase domain-containing protein [Candidatus Binatus sp.]